MQSLLDEMGAEHDSTTQTSSGDLVVARPEAVYFYSMDGRGPCFVFEGNPFGMQRLWHPSLRFPCLLHDGIPSCLKPIAECLAT